MFLMQDIRIHNKDEKGVIAPWEVVEIEILGPFCRISFVK
jgi:hypothetical protein